MRVKSVETYKPEEWAEYYRQRVRDVTKNPLATPRLILTRAFKRLLEEFEGNACLLAVVMEDLLTSPSSFRHVVGANEKLLTVGVFHRGVQNLGGL